MSKRKLADDVPSEDRSAKLTADVTSLNKSFASWVESQSKEKSAYFWAQGCEEYLAHVKSIKEDYADVLATKKQQHTLSEPTKPSTAPPAAAEEAPAAAPSTFGSFTAPAANAPAPTFSFGGGGAQASGSTAPQLFGVNASAGAAKDPMPSFSAGPTTFGGGFSFGSAPGSFGAVTTSAAPAASDGGGGGGGAEEEEEDGGAKFDSRVQKDDSTTVLFQVHAKVHVKQGAGPWEVKGTGSLTVREAKGARRPFVLLSTDAGRALMTALVPKGCKPHVPPTEAATAEKSKVRKLLAGMAVAQDEGPPKMMTMMVSVNGPEKRDELQRLLIQIGAKS